jgi:predicted dehydrogenase
MSRRVGFVTMGEAAAETGEVPTLGVGILGYAFMGKAHTNAFKKLDYFYTPPPAHARLVAIGGRSVDKVEAAARRYGYEKAVTDWHEMVSDPEIQVFDNSAPNNLHAEPCIAAAEKGKHVICE